MATVNHAQRLREMAERTPNAQDKPALLAGAAALKAMTPKPISKRHRDGNWWLVWEPFCERWVRAAWRGSAQMWVRPDDGYVVAPTHALPVPPEPEGGRYKC